MAKFIIAQAVVIIVISTLISPTKDIEIRMTLLAIFWAIFAIYLKLEEHGHTD